MEEKLTVQMTKSALYDFMLYHTYSKFSGFLTNVLGAAVGFMGIIMVVTGKAEPVALCFYLIAAAVFIAYTPLQLKFRAKRQMETNQEYKDLTEYTFTEQGIERAQGDAQFKIDWDQVLKVAATPKTIGFYYDENRAYIIPKEAFGDRFMAVMKLAADHVHPSKIRLR